MKYFIGVILVTLIMWGAHLGGEHTRENDPCKEGTAFIDPISKDTVYINTVDYYGQLTLRTKDNKTFPQHCMKVKHWKRL